MPEIGRKSYGMALATPPLPSSFSRGRELSGTTIRRKLAALSQFVFRRVLYDASLFEHLCDANAVTHDPVKGVKRPKIESYEGKRDRVILSVLLYHGLRREELCTLKVRDIH